MHRPRRLRSHAAIRALVQENHLLISDLICPIFVEENAVKAVELKHMPGVFRYPESQLAEQARVLYDLGIRYLMPFGISKKKDALGSDAWSEEGLLSRMIRTIKNAVPEMIVIPDICFCEYTDHGHCGIVKNGTVDNDATLINLAKQSVQAAAAGADFLAPSAMMDGQVAAIRKALDEAGYTGVGILAHAIKFASSLYGPFREAVDSSFKGDRMTYQADYHNARQGVWDALLDEKEGADILMVKPGALYLDILTNLRQKTYLPLAAYQVGGEYAMIKFAALAGALDEKKIVLESLIAFKRAGANMIVTYFAPQVAQWLAE